MASMSGDALLLLHGDLHLRVIAARNLPNRDLCSESLLGCFGSCVPVSPTTDRSLSAQHDEDHRRRHQIDLQHLHHHHKGITSDPYVTVGISSSIVARTSVIHNCEEPEWNENFKIPLAHHASILEFVVKDNDIIGAQVIGTATIPAATVISGNLFESWLPVLDSSGQLVKPGAALHVSFQFVHVDDNEIYAHGIAGDPQRRGVEDTYFPLRKGGSIKLYQDAHIRENELPQINLDGNHIYQHEKCWEDICHAILEARHLIYVVGWSIFVKVRLVRERTKGVPVEGEMMLGDLLKYKSEEGVRVCMLVWDDKTSHEMLKKAGVMNTHDEETRKFFNHSSVICVLSPRYPSSKLSIIKQQVVGTIYTHHQKCVIVDTLASEARRKITAFIGGLDIAGGRYDTPEHRLFKDLDTVFAGDFHNPTFDTKEKGPRQPWHDLHCRIEGPAAFDVLTNFEQRWKKATRHKINFFGMFKETSWRDDSLLKIDRISWIDSPSATCKDSYGDKNVWVKSENDSDTWHVQVFRSIDSGSVRGFPLYAEGAETKSQNLVRGKNIVIDKSIHTAYVKAIRCAKRFIYIENQYFIGSCYGWPSYKSSEADNLIPMELTLKIVEKIRKRERFCVYIVIPMWPEGDPKSAAVQEILFWQGQTMMMMYGIIGQELQSLGYNESPEDYLNFYCLGNREISNNNLQNIPSDSNSNSAVTSARRHRRFMIYVHAKGMIVDDEYVILGSANINQRSLDGSRDTEIAMGAYQPHHASNHNKHPHGQVYGYRKSLWAEHLGELNSKFETPETLECVKYVNQIANDNWFRYTAESNVSLKGHLMKYPVRVDSNGSVGSLPRFENFPDVGGKVLGAPTALPDELTM
ncbi:hypothetical protein LUZ60_016749 [Juncus effusus]|nr:hypothetical protein LUZ60_016749 [Juncus effusus]